MGLWVSIEVTWSWSYINYHLNVSSWGIDYVYHWILVHLNVHSSVCSLITVLDSTESRQTAAVVKSPGLSPTHSCPASLYLSCLICKMETSIVPQWAWVKRTCVESALNVQSNSGLPEILGGWTAWVSATYYIPALSFVKSLHYLHLCMILFNPHIVRNRHYYHLYFTQGETEAETGQDSIQDHLTPESLRIPRVMMDEEVQPVPKTT